jgi:hypothetical protein
MLEYEAVMRERVRMVWSWSWSWSWPRWWGWEGLRPELSQGRDASIGSISSARELLEELEKALRFMVSSGGCSERLRWQLGR